MNEVPFAWMKRCIECYMLDNPGISRKLAFQLAFDLWHKMDQEYELGMNEFQLMRKLKQKGII